MKKTIFLIIILFIGNSKALSQEVTIGTQIWSKNNLDVTIYSDGTPIPQVTDSSQWASLTTGAWCYYNNDSVNGNTYGKLYNWYAVAGIYNAASAKNPALRKKLAPIGWHVPSEKEWTDLFNFLGGKSEAGGKMKSTGTSIWQSPNTAATNSSGFTGLPGGYRSSSNGSFNRVRSGGYWWSSSEGIFDSTAWTLELDYSGGPFLNEIISRNYYSKESGFSVRCLRD
jgi:uncharacterized protein (TIGR02145 family)